MNERINELAKQAGFSNWVLNPSKETMSDTPELLEKFAELIIRECASAVNSRDDSDTGFWANIIKQHFGVEE